MINAGVLTISDKGSKGERDDRSGKMIMEKLHAIKAQIVAYEVIPDERDIIARKLRSFAEKANLILTTGGTGVAPRDVTPEATRDVIEKELPGFSEIMRSESFKITPRAVGSRAVSGIYKETLIINLPGSPIGATECLGFIIKAIPHTLGLIKGEVVECARDRENKT